MKPISRREFLRRLKVRALSFVGLVVLSPLYAIFAERFWYKVQEVELSLPRLPSAFHGKRIVHFSDVHLDHYFGNDHLAEVVQRINALQPDMICFTGDLFDKAIGDYGPRCVSLLSTLRAPLGKWAVLGNHDYGAGGRETASILQKAGFEVLINRNQVVELEGQRIRVAGLDDAMLGFPDMAKGLDGVDADEFTLLLVHEPDLADHTSQFAVDLQLSGHSHGGQIRLPWLGPLRTPPYGRKYSEGLYHVSESLKLYVNRGIGTTMLPIRFFCRPELTVLHLLQRPM